MIISFKHIKAFYLPLHVVYVLVLVFVIQHVLQLLDRLLMVFLVNHFPAVMLSNLPSIVQVFDLMVAFYNCETKQFVIIENIPKNQLINFHLPIDFFSLFLLLLLAFFNSFFVTALFHLLLFEQLLTIGFLFGSIFELLE